jgi:hypothetical protein
MSVYSGFSTRVQEAQYYKLVESLIHLLQNKVLFCLKNYPRPEDTSWLQRFNSVYNGLKEMEYHKYLEPKLTSSCKPLASYFSIEYAYEPAIDHFELTKPRPYRANSSSKALITSRPKVQNKGKVKKNFEKEPGGKAGMSRYYGKIMDNFLAQPKSVSPMKKSKATISMDSQDFWLLDDKITLIDNGINDLGLL